MHHAPSAGGAPHRSCRRCSAAVTPRRPLAHDSALDYDVMSDEEWEEEPEGEELGDCAADGDDDEEGSVDGGGDEDGFMVAGARMQALPRCAQAGLGWSACVVAGGGPTLPALVRVMPVVLCVVALRLLFRNSSSCVKYVRAVQTGTCQRTSACTTLVEATMTAMRTALPAKQQTAAAVAAAAKLSSLTLRCAKLRTSSASSMKRRRHISMRCSQPRRRQRRSLCVATPVRGKLLLCAAVQSLCGLAELQRWMWRTWTVSRLHHAMNVQTCLAAAIAAMLR